MTEKEFRDLITRYQSGEASSDEADAVEYWLEKRAEQNLYNEVSAAEKERIHQHILLKIQPISSRQRKTGKRLSDWFASSVVKNWRGIAAGVLILIATVGLIYYSGQSQFPQWQTLTSQGVSSVVEKVILSDGSIIWLKENSKLTFPDHFDGEERRVILKGEALFEIARDIVNPGWLASLMGKGEYKRPFVVQCGDLETRVVGTSFRIHQKDGETEVFVLTGKVEVNLPQQETIALLPNEKVVYRYDDGNLKKSDREAALLDEIRNQPEYEEITRGTEYDLSFKNETMSEVMRRISEKFDVEIQMQENIHRCLLRADLTDRSLKETLNLITETLNANYQIRDHVVIIDGDGCD